MADIFFGAFLSILTIYFSFKVRQNSGRLFLNDILTSVGGGSFFLIIKGFILGWIYVILCIGSGYGALVFLNKAGIIK